MKKLFLTSFAFLALAACQQSKSSDSNSTQLVFENSTPVVEKAVEKESSLSANVMEAANTGHSAMRFTHRTSSERAQVGVPYEIEIDFQGAADSVLNTEFRTTPGLSITSNAQASLQMNKLGKANSQKITVVPQQEGIHFVTIIDKNAKNQKPSAIKIIVGDKDIKEYMQSMGEIKEMDDGSTVVSMKAEEVEPE